MSSTAATENSAARSTGPDHPAASHLHSHREPPDRHRRSGRPWTWLTIAAAAVFAAAITLVAVRLLAAPADIEDTPEHSVEAFLTALLDDRDATEAAEWLCAGKADRDLTGAIAALSDADTEHGIAWSKVNETSRGVGEAAVTADLESGGATVTWTFGLVAEEGDPQWLVCDIDPA